MSPSTITYRKANSIDGMFDYSAPHAPRVTLDPDTGRVVGLKP